jgi:hypothetical protein
MNRYSILFLAFLFGTQAAVAAPDGGRVALCVSEEEEEFKAEIFQVTDRPGVFKSVLSTDGESMARAASKVVYSEAEFEEDDLLQEVLFESGLKSDEVASVTAYLTVDLGPTHREGLLAYYGTDGTLLTQILLNDYVGALVCDVNTETVETSEHVDPVGRVGK